MVAVGFGVALWNQSEMGMVRGMTDIEHSPKTRTPTVASEKEEPKETLSQNELAISNSAGVPSTFAVDNSDRQQPHYLRLREIALADGIDAIPASESFTIRVSTEPSRYGELMESLYEAERPRKRATMPSKGLFDWTSFFVPGETL